MKKSSIIVKVLAFSMTCVMLFSFAACGKKDKDDDDETSAPSSSATETTPMVTVPTTEATTTLMEYGSTIQPNNEEVKWTETAMEAKVMYVHINDGYLKIRKGPGTDFEQIGTLTAGMEVIVVAKTDNNWYKLEDGFYVSGDYISATP